MSWENRILTGLSVEELIKQQIETWPQLRDSVAAMKDLEYKKISVKGSVVLLQCNPKRIVSASAKVDPEAIKQRPCFLCEENLPPLEKAIEFGTRYVTLCNPFPILENHLVIAACGHEPQAIAGRLNDMADLAKEMGEGWAVLYNGARCGASAPDHFHFQAIANLRLPILDEVRSLPAYTLNAIRRGQAFTLTNYRVSQIIIRGYDREAITSYIETKLKSLAELTNSDEEPMINIVATYDNDEWLFIVFPRRKHRPDSYFAEGEKQILVSPGAIDYAGVVIVPVPEHFARITATDVENIFEETSM